MDSGNEISKMRLSTAVYPATIESLRELAEYKWLPSVDEALNRLVEFYSPTDSDGAVNHLLFESNLALDHLTSIDDVFDFFRTASNMLRELLDMAEVPEEESKTDEAENADACPEPEETEDEKPAYDETQLKNELREGTALLDVEILKTHFDTLKSCSSAMGMTIGELIDILALGFPAEETTEEEVLDVLTVFLVNISRLSHNQYIETLNTAIELLDFLNDSTDGSASPEDAERIFNIFKRLDGSLTDEILKMKKWKYDNSVVTTFLGFFPGLFGSQE